MNFSVVLTILPYIVATCVLISHPQSHAPSSRKVAYGIGVHAHTGPLSGF